MLYETAVAWLSQRLVVTAPARDWEETVEGFGVRLERRAITLTVTMTLRASAGSCLGAYARYATTVGGGFANEPRRTTRHGRCERKTAPLIIIIRL